MTPEELSSTLDFAPCFKSEFPLSSKLVLSLSNQRTKALVDSHVREDWEGIPVWHILGDSNHPSIQISPWLLEDEIGFEHINFKLIKDANHFVCFHVFLLPLSCFNIDRF